MSANYTIYATVNLDLIYYIVIIPRFFMINFMENDFSSSKKIQSETFSLEQLILFSNLKIVFYKKTV